MERPKSGSRPTSSYSIDPGWWQSSDGRWHAPGQHSNRLDAGGERAAPAGARPTDPATAGEGAQLTVLSAVAPSYGWDSTWSDEAAPSEAREAALPTRKAHPAVLALVIAVVLSLLLAAALIPLLH